MKKVNIVSVWTWFSNILDTQTLSASEQLIMLHLIKIFNRNFWQATKVSTSAICRSCGKDARTVKTALSSLIKAGYIVEKEGKLNLSVAAEVEKNNPSSLLKKVKAKAEKAAGAKEERTGAKENGRLASMLEENQLIEAWKEKGKFTDDQQKIFNELSSGEQKRIIWQASQQMLNFKTLH